MNASITLWEKWHEQVKEMLPGVHGHQKKTLALCVLGIILSQSAVLQRMAEAIALHGISEAKMPSIERRFGRFVANERIQVSKIWKQFLTQVLAYWKGKPVQLVLDCTPFDDRAIIVYVGLLVHSRVLPVAWRIMQVVPRPALFLQDDAFTCCLPEARNPLSMWGNTIQFDGSCGS